MILTLKFLILPAIQILDVYMDNSSLSICENERKFDAIVCVMLAAKVEENRLMLPKIVDICKNVKHACGMKDLRRMFREKEFHMIRSINFRLFQPTVATFVRMLLYADGISIEEVKAEITPILDACTQTSTLYTTHFHRKLRIRLSQT